MWQTFRLGLTLYLTALTFSPFLPFLKADSDFRVTPIGPIPLSPFMAGAVQLLAEVDTIALEPVEFFTLTIVLIGNQLPANAFASRSAFLHFEITVWILDASGKCLL